MEASWFLTGEHREYDEGDGTFGWVSPSRPLLGGDGPGAWQVAARFSRLDLDERFVRGGQLADATLGVNWTIDDALRLSWNWVRADLEGAGRTDILQLRFALSS